MPRPSAGPPLKLPRVAVFLDDFLTPEQEVALSAYLDSHPSAELHHGCGHADEAVLRVAGDLGVPSVVAHPSVDGRLVSRLALASSDVRRPPLSYWDRLRAQLRDADVVVVVTQAIARDPRCQRVLDVVHYCTRAGRGYVLIGPDGEVEEVAGDE